MTLVCDSAFPYGVYRSFSEFKPTLSSMLCSFFTGAMANRWKVVPEYGRRQARKQGVFGRDRYALPFPLDALGGGRPNMAQAGGKNPDGIDAAIAKVSEVLESQL